MSVAEPAPAPPRSANGVNGTVTGEPQPLLPGMPATRGDGPHPLNGQLIAGIDVGSNAMRLKIARVTSTGGLIPVVDHREPVRLGADVFRDRAIGPKTLTETLEAFGRFRALLDSYQVTQLRAVATSAMREAENSIPVVDRILEQTGIQIEVISSLEEAELVVRAVTRGIEEPSADMMIVDVGGGSVEVSVVEHGRIVAIEGFSNGTVRMLQFLAEQNREERDWPAIIRGHIAYMLNRIKHLVRLHPVEQMIAIGGNAGALATLGSAGNGESEGTGETGPKQLSATQLGEIIELIDSLAAGQRTVLLGLPERRADVIQPAAYLYQAAMQGAGLTGMVMPDVGLRDGLLWQMVDPLVAPQEVSAPDAVVYEMALDIGERYRFDRSHAEQTARLASRLFDELGELHRLPANERYLLVAAALLHDVGHLVNHGKHHHHTYYLIRNADFYGLSHREQEIVAQVAKFHRKGDPDPGRYPEFAALTHQDRVRVTKLTALLRVADALDRTHGGGIEDVHAKLKGGIVTLTIAGPVDINIERWAVAKKSGLFKRVFLTDIAVEPQEG